MEILNTTTETVLPGWLFLIIFVAVLAALYLLILLADVLIIKVTGDNAFIAKKTIIKVICSLVLVAAGVVIVLVAKEEHRVIEVKLSDEVSYKEIASKYELKAIRGSIYVLKEREIIK